MDVQPADFNTAPQVFHLMQGATENAVIDYGEAASGSRPTGPLVPGESLTGSVTVTALSSPTGASSLTTSNEAVNSAEMYVNGRTASAGEAVQFKVVASSSQTKGLYRLLVTVATDATPPRTLKKIIKIIVVDS